MINNRIDIRMTHDLIDALLRGSMVQSHRFDAKGNQMLVVLQPPEEGVFIKQDDLRELYELTRYSGPAERRFCQILDEARNRRSQPPAIAH